MARRLLLLSLAALLATAPLAEAKPGPKLTVMTRNIYLGGNIALPIGAGSRAEFEQRTTQLWQQVQATDFPSSVDRRESTVQPRAVMSMVQQAL